MVRDSQMVVWASVDEPSIWTLWVEELGVQTESWDGNFTEVLDDLVQRVRVRVRTVLAEPEAASESAVTISSELCCLDDEDLRRTLEAGVRLSHSVEHEP